MRTILIANSKGGCGKTTVATNLAGYFASRGRRVFLSDMDRQQSSLSWLKRRSKKLPRIHGIDGRSHNGSDPGAEWTVIDSPAGFHGEKLSDAIKQADWIIVPMQPSAFDIGATSDFLEALREEKAVRKERAFVAMVGTRVDPRTRAAATLNEFLQDTGFPVLTCLRNAQVYIQAAEQGTSLFDFRPSLVPRDLEQWSPLLQWLVATDK
ncbi:MAG TPA: ParA family protein [Methylophilaceae bacterium]|nr:ParA family protein [Methylophilaceae bacterium]HQR60723.1 ParA family protein [Methylophilaceae bacterium]